MASNIAAAVARVRGISTDEAQKLIRDSNRSFNRTVIVNFATDEHPHGCQYSCKFCSWREPAKRMGRISPSMEILPEFVELGGGLKITVSGGGEPLFEPENNLDELRKIGDSIHGAGRLMEVITMDYDTACRPEFDFVDAWSLSSQTVNRPLLRAIRQLTSRGKFVRVSIVDTGQSVLALAAYSNAVRVNGAAEVILREDFNTSESNSGRVAFNGTVRQKRDPVVIRAGCGMEYVTTQRCNNNFFLVGSKVLFGEAMIKLTSGQSEV